MNSTPSCQTRGEAGDCRQQLPNTHSSIAAIEECLADRAGSCGSYSGITGLAANAVRLGGRITVDQLSESAGMSGRQLDGCFLREIGIGPKLFCRILRFQQVFRAVENEAMGWAAIAAECGYYDQAHLIRDFQQFARQTPALFNAEWTVD